MSIRVIRGKNGFEMNFEIVPAGEVPLAEQAPVFNQAFAGYLAGWAEMDVAGVARFLSAQGADLCHSRFARDRNGALVSFGLINRTGNIPRLAGMGTVPAARRTGPATYLLSHLLDEAKARGDKAMMLEVIEQNLPAHALYQRYGFREVVRLFGWRRTADGKFAEGAAEQIQELSILTVSHRQSAIEYPDLPWQISRHAMTKLPAAARAYQLNETCIVIGDPETKPIRVHGLFSSGGDMDWNALRTGLVGVLSKFPKREFFAPAIFPEQFGAEIFEPLGFVREPLNQFLMRKDL